MDALPLVSILIPCYNAQATIERTLRSLERQSFANFEAVLVNDGSQDDTLRKVREIAARSSLNIRLIDQDNRGVSAARNAALEAAVGEYIVFLDADDVYHPGFILSMLRAIHDSGADVAHCLNTADIDRLMREEDHFGSAEHRCVSVEQVMERFMCNRKRIHFWCFIFRAEIIRANGIRFQVGRKYGEDSEFAWRYLTHCKRAAVVDGALYGYADNPNSANHRIGWDMTHMLDSERAVEQYMLANGCPFYWRYAQYAFARSAWYVAKSFSAAGRKDLYIRLREVYPLRESMGRLFADPDVTVRIGAIAYMILPQVFYHLVGLATLIGIK